MKDVAKTLKEKFIIFETHLRRLASIFSSVSINVIF